MTPPEVNLPDTCLYTYTHAHTVIFISGREPRVTLANPLSFRAEETGSEWRSDWSKVPNIMVELSLTSKN